MKRIWLAVILIVLSLAFCALGQVDRVEYSDFSGGLYAGYDSRKCPPNQFLELKNCIIQADGSLTVRGGFRKIVVPDNVTEAGHLFRFDGFPIITRTAGSTGVYANFVGSSTQLPLGFVTGFVSAATMDDYLIYGGYGGALYTWYKYATMAANITSSRIQDIIAHNDRVFYASEGTLYESAVGSATDFAGGEAWVVGGGEGGEITGLGQADGSLYVFKERKIFRMDGYSPSERVFTKISDIVGCTAGGNPISFKSASIGDGIIFPTDRSDLYMIANSQVYDVCSHIKKLLPGPGANFRLTLSRKLGLGIFYEETNDTWYALHLDSITARPGGFFIPVSQWYLTPKTSSSLPILIGGEDDFCATTGEENGGASTPLFLYYDTRSASNMAIDNFNSATMTPVTSFDPLGDERYLKNVRKITVRCSSKESAGTGLATTTTSFNFSSAVVSSATETASLATESVKIISYPSGYFERISINFLISGATPLSGNGQTINIHSIIADYVLGSRVY